MAERETHTDEQSAPAMPGADEPSAEAQATAAEQPLPAPAAEEETSPPEEVGVDSLAAAEARAAEYLALAQRTQADFENFRKRSAREAASAADRGVSRLAKELLPALDHLELALRAAEANVGQSPDPEGRDRGGGEMLDGIRLVQQELIGALSRVGIQAYSPKGDPFDPSEHEAMASQPVEGAEPGTVAEVYQQGYRLNGAVLRPARVVVAA
ncbi:MAG TPA: nucleotide exchange factor GrpE [Solirubrobacteraceae bacterium]|nr:nucleotide exchange factor GrpE [Solirubrobacteraceae bacterium]